MEFRWQNNFTGEVHRTLAEAIFTAIKEFCRLKTCRTLKIFNIGRFR